MIEKNNNIFDQREEVARRIYKRIQAYNRFKLTDNPITKDEKRRYFEEDYYLLGYLERLTDTELTKQ